MQATNRNESQNRSAKPANRQKLQEPVFIDGIHSFRQEGDCVVIDMFILKSTTDNQFGRERAIQLKMPLSQFHYFAKSMLLKAEKLTPAVTQTKRAELTLVHAI